MPVAGQCCWKGEFAVYGYFTDRYIYIEVIDMAQQPFNSLAMTKSKQNIQLCSLCVRALARTFEYTCKARVEYDGADGVPLCIVWALLNFIQEGSCAVEQLHNRIHSFVNNDRVGICGDQPSEPVDNGGLTGGKLRTFIGIGQVGLYGIEECAVEREWNVDRCEVADDAAAFIEGWIIRERVAE